MRDYLPELVDARLTHRPYRAYSENWGHDHCEVCKRGFSEDYPGDLREGYTTTRDYAMGGEYCWVCDECFTTHRDEMGWRVVEDDRPVRPAGLPIDESIGGGKEPRLHD